MSYEGYEELLCAKGHHHEHDCYDTRPLACPHCGSPWTHQHAVDETNGFQEEGIPGSWPAPTDELGSEDVWHTDHHGNRYATKLMRHAPKAGWTRI